jgi:hypothetical protein
VTYTKEVDFLDRLRQCIGFDWDKGNAEKNWEKHRVARGAAEQMFFNAPLVVAGDPEHSEQEERFFALGQTTRGRLLFAVFAIRGELIRVISIRDMTKAEREAYRAS